MILYHYTENKNLLGISLRGLKPPDEGAGLLTMGQPVVWLTTQETLAPTQADLDHLRRTQSDEQIKPFVEAGTMILGPDTRLTIRLRTPDRKLVHYYSWLRTTDIAAMSDTGIITGRDLAEKMCPTARKHWWIYFGTIKPARIELNMTPMRALPGIEYNLADAIEENDPGRIATITAFRDQMKALPLDQPINIVPAIGEMAS
jgi:hypothetical protein